MRILVVASEMAPYAKTGGLADVIAALPAALLERGHEVQVVIPRYPDIVVDAPAPTDGGVGFEIGFRTWRTAVEMLPLTSDAGVPVQVVDAPALYDRPTLYTDDPDEHARFLLLARSALSWCETAGWIPDVIHCNDWQTAMIPLLLRSGRHPALEGVPTVLTIHNLGYQGVFGSHVVDDLALGPATALLDPADLAAGTVNFLRHGLEFADVLTTVSPTYAAEIQTPEHGHGLDPILRRRRDDLVGILNGIDTEVWNPRTDPHLTHRYSAGSLWRKERGKQAVLDQLGLDHDGRVAVMGLVSRLVWQKGVDLVAGAVPALMATHPHLRMVALGSGEPSLERSMAALQDRYPGRVSFTPGYDIELSHRIEAAADMFLMPSRYEPSGLNQMYSLAYGTAPLVRNTGGLADTVTTFDPVTGEGNGVVFDHADVNAVQWAVETALGFHTDPALWKTLQRNAMAADHSWDRSAAEYEEVFVRAIAAASSSP